MNQRLNELSVIAENDEDVALQLESERFLTLGDTVDGISRETIAWANEVADTYLVSSAPRADDETIQKLAEEIDF